MKRGGAWPFIPEPRVELKVKRTLIRYTKYHVSQMNSIESRGEGPIDSPQVVVYLFLLISNFIYLKYHSLPKNLKIMSFM